MQCPSVTNLIVLACSSTAQKNRALPNTTQNKRAKKIPNEARCGKKERDNSLSIKSYNRLHFFSEERLGIVCKTEWVTFFMVRQTSAFYRLKNIMKRVL